MGCFLGWLDLVELRCGGSPATSPCSWSRSSWRGSGFCWTYKTVARIRESRRLAPVVPADGPARSHATQQIRWMRTVIYLTLVSFGVSLLFARPEKPFFACPLPILSDWFDPAKGNWFGMSGWDRVLARGVLRSAGWVDAGLISFMVNLTDRSPQWTWRARSLRAYSAFSSGLISGAGLAAALMLLRAGRAAVMSSGRS